jgi:hypothetical protein
MISVQDKLSTQDYEKLPGSFGTGEDLRIPAKLREYMQSENIAELLEDEKLEQIAYTACNNIQQDDDSRAEWKQILKDAIKVVEMTHKEKTFPWPKAANIKYPLVLNALIQFNSRVLPQLIKGDKVVLFDVMAPDPTDKQTERAERLSRHMSYQLIGKDSSWLTDKDKMLMVFAFSGNAFTKTYRDTIRSRNVVEFCQPEDIIINQGLKDLESAPRITHRMEKSLNFIVARQNAGEYLKIPVKELMSVGADDDDSSEYGEGTLQYNQGITSADDYDQTEIDYSSIHVLYEHHFWLDLDDDGYQEPYIAIIHKESKKVLRIVARYDEQSFIFAKDPKKSDKFIEILPIQAFTHYMFIPSYDGGFYGMGFAHFLAPMNIAVNTLLNQLIDSGTLSNLQAGFIGKGLRMRKGDMRLQPGEWKLLDNAPGSNIKDNIVPLPSQEPSMVLFQLLGMLIKAGEETSSVSDVMQGQTPSAGTPATTVVNLIQQGMKVFGAVLLRTYHSLKSEYEKIYALNKKYATSSEYYRSALGSGMIKPGDYQDDDYGVFPVADPNLSVDTQVLMKAQALYQAKDDPNIDPREATLRFLEAIKIPNIQKAMTPPVDPNNPPPPPPEVLKIQSEIRVNDSQTSLNLTKTQEIGERVQLDETKMLSDIHAQGATIAEMKIDSGIKIAESESMLGKQAVEEGLKKEDQVEESDMIEQTIERMAEQEAILSAQAQESQGEGGGQGLPEGAGQPQPGAPGSAAVGSIPPAAAQALQGGQGGAPAGEELGATVGIGGKEQE